MGTSKKANKKINTVVTQEEININKIKTIITLGPSTRSENSLRKIKDKGVDFVRVNMSHSTLEDLEHFLNSQ